MAEPDVIPTFDKTFGDLCDTLKLTNKVLDITKHFLKTTTDEERVKIAYGHLGDANLFPITTDVILPDTVKSAKQSIILRNEANKLFGKLNADLTKVVQLYTRSLSFAPWPSEELAISFANRSAVFFAMRQYETCVNDIRHALAVNYPQKLHYKVLERQAKCLQKMGLLEEAKSCLQLAIESPLPEDKSSAIQSALEQLKLETISSEQLKITKQEESPKESRLLRKSFGPNKEVPCATDCLEIKFSTEMGRYAVATKNIMPGDILLLEEPFASILQPEHYQTHCYNCLKRFAALIPCTHCSLVLFCSDECRSNSWQKSHEIECPLLPSLHRLDMGKIWILTIRIIIIASKNGRDFRGLSKQIEELEKISLDPRTKGFNNGVYESNAYSSIHYLVGNTESRTVSDLFKRATKAACILKCMELKSNLLRRDGDFCDNKFFVGGLIMRFLQSLPCNAHSISDVVSELGQEIPTSFEYGCGAYAMLSLLNHSCEPNVTRCNYDGDKMALVAVEPIKSGGQIYDNYGFHYAMQEKEQRISGLKTQYHFTCECQACTSDWPTYLRMPSTSPSYLCGECSSVLPPVARSSRKSCVSCEKCKHENDVSSIELQLQKSNAAFGEIYQKLLYSDDHDFILELSQHLVILDKSVRRPWKVFNDFQEALKECFLRVGNIYKK